MRLALVTSLFILFTSAFGLECYYYRIRADETLTPEKIMVRSEMQSYIWQPSDPSFPEAQLFNRIVVMFEDHLQKWTQPKWSIIWRTVNYRGTLCIHTTRMWRPHWSGKLRWAWLRCNSLTRLLFSASLSRQWFDSELRYMNINVAPAVTSPTQRQRKTRPFS